MKVLVGRDGYAVYFSRHPIPWREGLRDAGGAAPGPAATRSTRPGTCGTSASTPTARRSCRRFTTLEPTFGERSERLEQLRILEHGHRIRVVVTPWDALAVDTPEDLERARERAARGKADAA